MTEPNPVELTTVYVSISNSDDKLSQAQWAQFCREFRQILDRFAHQTYGEWFSESSAAWQNACRAIAMRTIDTEHLKTTLLTLRTRYNQESIAWAIVPETEFI